MWPVRYAGLLYFTVVRRPADYVRSYVFRPVWSIRHGNDGLHAAYTAVGEPAAENEWLS